MAVLALVPRTLVRDLSVQLLPNLSSLLRANQREDGARNYRDIGATDEFQGAQRVGHFFFAPRVAGDDGNTEHFDVGRLDEYQDGLLVCSRRARCILINDDVT